MGGKLVDYITGVDFADLEARVYGRGMDHKWPETAGNFDFMARYGGTSDRLMRGHYDSFDPVPLRRSPPPPRTKRTGYLHPTKGRRGVGKRRTSR